MRTKEQDRKKVYFITGGGTGGHIYPALVVANALKEQPNCDVFYIGNPKKPEAELAKSNGLKFLPVNITYMPRKIDLQIIFWLFRLAFACLKSMLYILKYKPDAVFATGGYVSAPALLASIVLSVPFMMHDGDAVPGIVTRKISPFAKCVSLTFEEAKKYVKNKNACSPGNPIREDFAKLDRSEARKLLNFPDNDKLILLVMGGSQGAKGINNTIVELYKYLVETYNIGIIHQTGAKNYDEVIEVLEKIYPEYKNNNSITVRPYFDNAAIVMKASDIAVSRAGSLSISELCASGLASVLVPYPFAAANHQFKNAQAVEKEGAALCIEENEQLKDNLKTALDRLIKDETYRNELKASAQRLAKPNAKADMLKLLEEIAE